MTAPEATDETVRAFATTFLDGAFADTAGALTEAGRGAVVASFPDEFQQEETMSAADALEAYWRGLYSQYGPPEQVGDVSADGDTATVELLFDGGTATATVGTTADGVTAFSFAPTYEPPTVVDRDAFSERPVTIDAGDIELDGILTRPAGDGPFPGAILVHGAGMHDPDGRVGASQILKDIAWGLANDGIATIRYEHRLRSHEVANEEYTLDTVIVDDAGAALDTLAAVDAVAENASFVVGHSQGGMCAPRIAARHQTVAGVVVLDARADSTHDPDDLTLFRYELDPEGSLDTDQTAELEEIRATVRRLAEGDYDDTETIWGRPGTWHRSVRDYEPAATASSLAVPIFVLKTSRADEEIQPDLKTHFRAEFEKWQAVDLPPGSRVTFYEGLDHYFQEGFAPAHPLSLYFGGNVSGNVLADLSEWLHETTPSP